MAVAEASFSTSIDSISFVLRLESGLMTRPWPSVTDSLIRGTPSMTYSGSFVPLIELVPRMRIEAPPPG